MITLFENRNNENIENKSQSRNSYFDCTSGCRHSNPCPSAYGVTYVLPQESKS